MSDDAPVPKVAFVKKPFKRGCGRDVAQYFQDHIGKIVGIEQLEIHFRGTWDRRQILHALANSTREKGTNLTLRRIECLQQFMWRLPPLEAETDKVGYSFEQLTVTIIKEQDDEMVVVDDNTNIYRMVKVG